MTARPGATTGGATGRHGASVTEDGLLDGRVRLRQPAEGYRVAIDPVLLAAAVDATPGEAVLDLGCGVGAAALCLLARIPDLRVAGLEVQETLVALARENAALNGRSERFAPLAGDVLAPPEALTRGAFDHVLCNPPYLEAEAGGPTKTGGRALATRESSVRLADWVRVALEMVRAKGSVTFVHRADRMDALIALLHGRAGALVVFPFWPAAGKPAKRVILRARKAVAAPSRLAAGLVLHRADGRFTAEAEAVLREAGGLTL